MVRRHYDSSQEVSTLAGFPPTIYFAPPRSLNLKSFAPYIHVKLFAASLYCNICTCFSLYPPSLAKPYPAGFLCLQFVFTFLFTCGTWLTFLSFVWWLLVFTSACTYGLGWPSQLGSGSCTLQFVVTASDKRLKLSCAALPFFVRSLDHFLANSYN